VDIFEPVEEVTATPSPFRLPTLTPPLMHIPAPQPQAEAWRAVASVIPTPAVRPGLEQRVSLNSKFSAAYTVEKPPSKEERGEMSVSDPALSSLEHAAAHPSVTHITDTLVPADG
jgi:hypothetical protein